MYVKIDDMLRDWPDLAPVRPATGTPLTLSDAELLTMAVMSALLGFTSERRWLRYADKELAGMFPRTIGQSGWNKRVRKAFFLFIRVIRMLAMDTSLWSDDVWVVDSTPVQCGCSRRRSSAATRRGWAEYGLSRQSLPVLLGFAAAPGSARLTGFRRVMFALAGAKADERETLR